MAIKYESRPFAVTTTGGSSASLSQQTGTTADNRIVTVKTVTDDGAGSFIGSLGSVSYAGKSANVKVIDFDRSTEAYKSDYENASDFSSASAEGGGTWNSSGAKGGSYGTASIGEELFAGSSVVARYRVGTSSPVAHAETYTPPVVAIDLCPTTAQRIVPGSVQFAWMGQTYQDFEGKVYRGRTDVAPGTLSGAIDYQTGHVLMTDYVVGGSGPQDFTLQSLWTAAQDWNTASLFFNTDAAPLRAGAGGLVLTVNDTAGSQLTANVGALGQITGSHMWGTVDFSRGGVQLQFGDFVLASALTDAEKAEWWYDPADVGAVQADKIWRPWPVLPETMRYSCVSFIYLPVDVSLMGIDPAALPPDGRVAFARPGDTCVIGVTHGGSSFVPTNAMVYDTGHQRLSFVQVLDAATGAEVIGGYTADLDAGTVTFTDVASYPASVKVVAREEVYRQIAEVRIDGSVRLTQPIGKAFGTDAIFSTALRQGDRFARVSRVYDQASWSGSKWTDGVDPAIGEAPATFNSVQHPIVVTNAGAITERWAIKMRAGGTTFDLIGQHLGQIASGDINSDFAPNNAAASAPYFTLPAAGWGSGWVAGNTLFFDTVGAEAPLDLVRCTMPSTPAGIDDSFWIVQRGDVDRPSSAP
ncbi:MAG: hypothetical protein WA917_13595 [Comamonas sp.]